MEEIDVLIKQALSLGQSRQSSSDSGVEAIRSRVNPVFENFELKEGGGGGGGGKFDHEIHWEWQFAPPRTTTTGVNIELYRIASDSKEYPRDLIEPLESVDKLINRLRALITYDGDSTNEADLLAYTILMRNVARVFDANTNPYSYYVPSDGDDEKNTSGVAVFFMSRKFQYEYMNAILALLSRYNTRANDEAVELRERALLNTYCIELLREIENVCESIVDTHRPHNRIVHRIAPQTMSSSASSVVTPTSSSTKKDGDGDGGDDDEAILREYTQYLLGGVAHIRARRYVCEAKKAEAYFRNFEKTKEKTDENFYKYFIPVLGTIVDAYDAAHNTVSEAMARRRNLAASKIERFTRFMAQYWQCVAQHMVAEFESAPLLVRTETGADEVDEKAAIEKACHAYARLIHVSGRCRQFESLLETQSPFIQLDEPLTAKYNEVVSRLFKLTRELDTELYELRHIKVNDSSSSSSSDKTAFHIKASNSFTKLEPSLETLSFDLVTKDNALRAALYAIQRLGVHLGLLESIEPHIGGDDGDNDLALVQRQSRSVVPHPMTRHQQHIDEDDDLTNAYRYGILRERERWYTWLRSLCDPVAAESKSLSVPISSEMLREVSADYKKVQEQLRKHEQ